MKKNHVRRRNLLLLILVWGLLFPSQGYAAQVQDVETEGSIGFTGVYDPIGSPEPSPPDTIARPPSNRPSRLPQTNDQAQHWLQWLGGALLLWGFVLIKRKKNQEEQPNPKT